MLQERGHRVVTPQLPSDRPGHGAAANAQAVLEAIGSPDGQEIVLVGHSAGGLTIPMVAQHLPVLHMIFVAALLPVPGLSVSEDFEADAGAEVAGFTWTTRADGLLEMDHEVARHHFFHDCPAGPTDAALAQLRLQTPTTLEEKSPLDAWPHVTSDYVVCSRDRVLAPAWQQRIAEERLGVEPVTIASGHSPALACPEELADRLEELAVRRSERTPAA
ncbi:alpha/beta hydrolase [Kineosporia babensis]|uniref:Alpha/beta hydrolase n=1 Tax=Kineosporia babensis TaxID=499548 RepID=A0A9X1T3Y2_9ACTN|nr:alpha/beta hydrolase [Kineosporia babensis]